MLQNKYLPEFHFDEQHSIVIHAPADRIFPCLENIDFSGSRIVRILFWLRGLPEAMLTTAGLEHHRFYVLERVVNEEIIIGLIGQFWRPSGNLQVFKPYEFVPFDSPGFAKATWNFRIEAMAEGSRLETVTRVYCTDNSTRRKFSPYWWVVKPFSGWIRMEILKAIKRKAEHGSNT